MCLRIPLKRKAQPAPGFPNGWKFAFYSESVPKLGKPYITLEKLRLLSPDKGIYKSVDLAMNQCIEEIPDSDLESAKDSFYKCIGAHVSREERDHVLIGKSTCQELSLIHI